MMRPQLQRVLKRLICQTECKCYNNINFRGLTFQEYQALRDNKNKLLCFYDKSNNFRIKIKPVDSHTHNTPFPNPNL